MDASELKAKLEENEENGLIANESLNCMTRLYIYHLENDKSKDEAIKEATEDYLIISRAVRRLLDRSRQARDKKRFVADGKATDSGIQKAFPDTGEKSFLENA